MRKLIILGIVAILSMFVIACSSETKTTTNQPKESLKSAMEIIKKAKEKTSTMKGDSYTEKYKLEHTFQSEAEDGMSINFTNVRIHEYNHDRIFNPYTEHITGQYKSNFRINLKGSSYDGDMGDTNTFQQEEYRVNGKIYYKAADDTTWTVSPLGKVSPSFRVTFLDELLKLNNNKNIKLTNENGLYKLVFDKAFFDENKQLFEFYKEKWPYNHATDFVEEKLKKDSGQTILYDKAQFKNPIIEIWVDQNNFMIKKFSVISSIRIPTVSTERGKDGKIKEFPPSYIDEEWSSETKSEYTGSINLPPDAK